MVFVVVFLGSFVGFFGDTLWGFLIYFSTKYKSFLGPAQGLSFSSGLLLTTLKCADSKEGLSDSFTSLIF